MAKITVLGSGGWGMALALTANDCGHDVTLWSPFKDEVEHLSKNRTNERLLPGVILPDEIGVTDDLSVVEGSLITIIATPSMAVRETAVRLKKFSNFGIVVNVSKGFEKDSLKRLSVVLAEELPRSPIAVLSGPSHAEEVAKRIPTSLVVASNFESAPAVVQNALSNEFLRIYTSEDIIGVELGGAVKNVIAICAGALDGMGLGDNTKAALMTRGLSEMTRLGVLMGANEHTFLGLAGVGDLIVTCTSRHSRNNRFGYKIGSGVDVKTALSEVGTVEGYYATEMVQGLSVKYGVELPIINTLYSVLYENRGVENVIRDLMLRPKGAEK